MRALLALALIPACTFHPRAIPDPDADVDAREPDAEPPPDPVQALANLQGTCTEDRWCWTRPKPRGVRMNAMHHTSKDDIWIVGESGLVLQWNGTIWREHVLAPLPPEHHDLMHVFSVHGLGPNDVWVTGGSFVEHWDGTQWTIEDRIPVGIDQRFETVWEAPNGDVWVAMDYGVLERKIGGGPFVESIIPQTQSTLSELGSIWGAAPDDVWISGRPGRKFHWNGSVFEEGTVVGAHAYHSGGGFWGSGPSDIWSGNGIDGELVHYNGTQWSEVDSMLGNTWSLQAIAGLAANDVWWVAQKSSISGAFLHWDGSSITKTTFQSELFIYDLEIIDGRWWMPGDDGALFVKDSITAPIVNATHAEEETFSGIWGTADNNLYVVGPGVLGHFDGKDFVRIVIPGMQLYRLAGISGTQVGMVDELWAVGSDRTAGMAYHFDGTTWSVVQTDGTHQLNAVAATGSGEAIAVGDGGVIYRFTGGTWVPLASGVTANLNAIWAPDANHAWIAGANGTVLYWDRATPAVLTPEPTGITEELDGIHGSGSSVWIASRSIGTDTHVGVYERTSTGTWVRHVIDQYEGGPVFATSPTDIMFGSGHGRLFRYDGSTIHEERTGAPDQPIEAVFQPPGGSPWIGGMRALLHRKP